MNKKLMAVFLACAVSLTLVGCGHEGPIENKNGKMQVALLAHGPAARLACIDNEVMLPILDKIAQDDLAAKELLKLIQAGLVRLQNEEAIHLNDAYLYFGKSYLQVAEEYLQLCINEEAVKAKALKQGRLEDAKLAFLNARNKILQKQSLYRLASLEAAQLHQGMSYAELRELLQMPGEHLESFAVTDYKNKTTKKIEPVLWVANGQYLYVEFVEGKSSVWKLHKGIALGKKADRKVRKQVETWDAEIVKPVWGQYEAYRKHKGSLAKQKIYNEAAAQKQKAEIEGLLQAIAAAKSRLSTVEKSIVGTDIYLQQTELLLKQLEERMQYAQNLACGSKDKKFIRESLTKGNRLEGWDIWRTYYTYSNALEMLLNGKSSYQFPKWVHKEFPKKPWLGSLMHWFRMPGEQLHRHMVQDDKNPRKWHRHDTYVWVQGDGFVYGYFVDDRLIKWQTLCTNDGFYNEK